MSDLAMTQTHTQTAPDEPDAENAPISTALILSGGLKSPDLMNRFGWPLSCLPQTKSAHVIDTWFEAFKGLGLDENSVYVMTDALGKSLWARADRSPNLIEDQAPYRGPAGVLLDAFEQINLDRPCVIIEHSRMLESPGLLASLVESHKSGGQSITIATNPNGTFSGILIADAEPIRMIPRIGFMDIKEQWIPAAHTNGLGVARVPLGGWSYQIRSRSAYLTAIRKIDGFGNPLDQGVIGRSAGRVMNTRYGGGLVTNGAQVDPSASIAHSVVCPGAVVGERAIVVRSIIGPGARVANDAVVVDSTVKAADDKGSR